MTKIPSEKKIAGKKIKVAKKVNSSIFPFIQAEKSDWIKVHFFLYPVGAQSI